MKGKEFFKFSPIAFQIANKYKDHFEKQARGTSFPYFFFCAASHSKMVTGRPLSMTGESSKSVLAVLAWE